MNESSAPRSISSDFLTFSVQASERKKERMKHRHSHTCRMNWHMLLNTPTCLYVHGRRFCEAYLRGNLRHCSETMHQTCDKRLQCAKLFYKFHGLIIRRTKTGCFRSPVTMMERQTESQLSHSPALPSVHVSQ